MREKTIVFDLDGVLADFVTGFYRLGSEVIWNGKEIALPEQRTWDEFPPFNKNEIDVLWKEIKQRPAFWAELPALVPLSMLKDINALGYKHRLYFATSRVGPDVLGQTRWWLNSRGIITGSVVVTKYKGEFCKIVNADFCIDDKAENAWCVAWLSPGTESYLLNRPYNKTDGPGSSKIIRVDSVQAYLDDIAATN